MFGPLKTVGFYVNDQDKAIAFYTDILGFELRRKLPMGAAYWVEVAPKGAQTCLVLYPKSMMKDWNERKLSVVFYCENVESVCAQLQSKGVTIAMEPSEMPWGMFAMIEDPDGNQIGMTSQAIALRPE